MTSRSVPAFQTNTERVFRFICLYLARHGYPPSRDEIGSRYSLNRRQLELCLTRLAMQRRIQWTPAKARGFALVE
jgi:SOS-response transcriptional repressor LexA